MQRAKAAVLTFSTAVSLAGGYVAWTWWQGQSQNDLEFHEVGSEIDRIRAERAVYAAERRVDAGVAIEPTERTYYLSEDHVARLFGLDNRPKGLHRFDPWTYVIQKAFRDQSVGWSEHPDHKYALKTNEDGLRDDPIDWESDPDLRVLVAGDSHTFGVCANDESYPNRLEQRLAAAWPEHSVDVLNAGQGGYSFYQYLGMLEKYRELKPDVFVLGVFGGNDFSEIVGLADAFGEGPAPNFEPEQRKVRRDAIAKLSRAAMGQCYTGTFYFAHHQDDVDQVYGVALDLVAQMRAVCEARGTKMVVAFIPAPCDLAWDPPIDALTEVREFLDLGPEAIGVLDALATRFVDDVRATGLPVVDLRETIAELDVPPYWRRDLHLNVDGHDLLAAELQPVVEAQAFEAGLLDPR